MTPIIMNSIAASNAAIAASNASRLASYGGGYSTMSVREFGVTAVIVSVWIMALVVLVGKAADSYVKVADSYKTISIYLISAAILFLSPFILMIIFG